MKGWLTLLALLLFFLLISCNSAETVAVDDQQGATEQIVPDNARAVSPARAGKASEGQQATEVTHFRNTVTGLLYNTCLGELVDYQGTIEATSRSKSWKDGFQELLVDIDIHGKGTGRTSQDKYVIKSGTTTQVSYVLGPPYPVSRTITIERNLISNGKSDNAYLTTTLQTEIDADGHVTFSKITSTTECR